jgi:adenine phosphoribosyltransferase
MKDLNNYVKAIPDFPKPGILFRDVTGILESPDGFQLALDMTVGVLAAVEFDLVAAPESRGFIFGAALADRFRTAFVPIRKPGKLPRETISESYDLEYGKATLHMHTDAVKPGQRVVIVDDLLATGGTAKAAAKLVERLGGTVVKMIFPIELEGFRAREGLLKGYDVASLVKYRGSDDQETVGETMKIPLIGKILIGFVLGTAIGLAFSEFCAPETTAKVMPWVAPFGNVLVAMLKMVV